MKNAKRYLAVALSFALFLALPLAFTQEAAAASGTKVTQLDKVIYTSTDYYDNGSSETSTNVTAFAYDKKGLNTLTATQDSKGTITGKSVYGYSKSGYKTSYTEYTAKDEPFYQELYTVKKGRRTAEADYTINGTEVKLTGFTKTSYKSGKKSKVEYSSADGKTLRVATYKKGVLSKVVEATPGGQSVTDYDKYGNETSYTYVDKDTSAVTKTVYKNTYKNGKLVKIVSTTAFSDSKDVFTGLTVLTYKKDKLVKVADATTYTYADFPEDNCTMGTTTTYAYTKGGLIKTVSFARSTTTAAGTKINEADVIAYQYQKVTVDKKCVKAVKEAMEKYNYKNVQDLFAA